jgi:hypothetical protein
VSIKMPNVWIPWSSRPSSAPWRFYPPERHPPCRALGAQIQRQPLFQPTNVFTGASLPLVLKVLLCILPEDGRIPEPVVPNGSVPLEAMGDVEALVAPVAHLHRLADTRISTSAHLHTRSVRVMIGKRLRYLESQRVSPSKSLTTSSSHTALTWRPELPPRASASSALPVLHAEPARHNYRISICTTDVQ